MDIKTKDVGKLGEDLAVDFLADLDHEIMARNYRAPCGELDIVSCEKYKIHFTEVKTCVVANISRETGIFAEEKVTREKLARVAKTAQIFMDEFSFYDNWVQIDVIAVYISKQFIKGHIKDSLLGPVKGIDYRIVYLKQVG